MKRNKNVITFIPKHQFVPAYAPKPDLMSKNLPAWWRKQEPYTGGTKEVFNGQYNETVKKCPGILDLLVSGYLLKTPCDIYVDTTGEEIVFDVATNHRDSVSMHTRQQVSGWTFDRDYYMDDVFRIHPMWVVGTSDGYSTLFVHPSFQDDLPFRVVPAIIDTDKYISDGPFSLLFKKGFKGVIEQGTPLVQCIPYLREEHTMEILDKPDLKKLDSLPKILRSKFGGAYKKFFQTKKVFR